MVVFYNVYATYHTYVNLLLFLIMRKIMHTVLEQLKQIPIETQVEGIAYSKFNGKSN